ncbi:MAG TPA: hypothetical protein VE338_01360 [Ktedonobacterales bacterium]|nr:hypothetical protein [Ktedonobacterales bacterium]
MDMWEMGAGQPPLPAIAAEGDTEILAAPHREDDSSTPQAPQETADNPEG